MKLTVEVQNIGALDAPVVQVYRHMKHSVARPEQTKGFAKVHPVAGASGSVEIDLAQNVSRYLMGNNAGC